MTTAVNRSALEVRPLTASFGVTVEPKIATPAHLVDLIERAWAAEQVRRGGRLTNGAILSFVRWDGDKLVARRGEYRSLIAQRRHPELFAELQIRALAVSGLARCGSEILFGVRSDNVTQDAGRWELVPSGSVSPLPVPEGDGLGRVLEQCAIELEEETGIARAAITRAEPFVLVEDTEAHVIDIGVELELRDFQPTLPRSDEYGRLVQVSIDSLSAFCGDHDVIPVSRALLERRGLLAPTDR